MTIVMVVSCDLQLVGLAAHDVIPKVSDYSEFDRVVSEVMPHVLSLHILEPGKVHVRAKMVG